MNDDPVRQPLGRFSQGHLTNVKVTGITLNLKLPGIGHQLKEVKNAVWLRAAEGLAYERLKVVMFQQLLCHGCWETRLPLLGVSRSRHTAIKLRACFSTEVAESIIGILRLC